MKRNLLVLLTMVLFVFAGPVACKKSAAKLAAEGQEKITGSWILDADATIAGMPEEERQMAQLFINMMRLGMVFGEDGTLEMHVSMMGQSESQTGNFKVLSADATSVRFEVSRPAIEGESEAEVQQMIARFEEGGKIAVTPITTEDPEGTSATDRIVLRKLSPEEFKTAMEAPSEPADLQQLLGLPEGVELGVPGEALEAPAAVEGAVEGAEGAVEAPAAPAEAPAAE